MVIIVVTHTHTHTHTQTDIVYDPELIESLVDFFEKLWR